MSSASLSHELSLLSWIIDKRASRAGFSLLSFSIYCVCSTFFLSFISSHYDFIRCNYQSLSLSCGLSYMRNSSTVVDNRKLIVLLYFSSSGQFNWLVFSCSKWPISMFLCRPYSVHIKNWTWMVEMKTKGSWELSTIHVWLCCFVLDVRILKNVLVLDDERNYVEISIYYSKFCNLLTKGKSRKKWNEILPRKMEFREIFSAPPVCSRDLISQCKWAESEY